MHGKVEFVGAGVLTGSRQFADARGSDSDDSRRRRDKRNSRGRHTRTVTQPQCPHRSTLPHPAEVEHRGGAVESSGAAEPIDQRREEPEARGKRRALALAVATHTQLDTRQRERWRVSTTVHIVRERAHTVPNAAISHAPCSLPPPRCSLDRGCRRGMRPSATFGQVPRATVTWQRLVQWRHCAALTATVARRALPPSLLMSPPARCRSPCQPPPKPEHLDEKCRRTN